MSEDRPRPSSHPAGVADDWGRSLGKAALILVVSALVFMVVPDRLLTYLSREVAPRIRDSLVSLWWIVSFVVLTWAFVRVQGRRKR